MPALDDLKAIDLDEASVSLWLFKKTPVVGEPPRFKGRWVETTTAVDDALKGVVALERDRITEVMPYGVLTQNNEVSALSIDTLETHAGLIVDQIGALTPDRKVGSQAEIANAVFYVARIVHDDHVICAVRKTDSSWQTRRANGFIRVFFDDHQMQLEEARAFSIARSFDFFIVDNEVLVANKGRFESVVEYKAAHMEDFAELQTEAAFVDAFSDLSALQVFVGNNKMQLRRMVAIRQKGHYRDPRFMANLRQHHARFNLKIQFDTAGKIVPSPETCRDIFQALLDHRLQSGFSDIVYDVPDAAPV